jgi:hypothetical protein
MRPLVKLALFGVVLLGGLAAGLALGAAVGPLDEDEAAGGERRPSLGAGLVASAGGFTLAPVSAAALQAGEPSEWSFRITDSDGVAVRDFELEQEKELHLVVVDRGLRSYAHVHPERDAAGTWSVRLPAMGPGVYRAFIDAVPADGPALTLGTDLSVAGEFAPMPGPNPSTHDEVDGFAVELLTSGLVADESADVALTVRRSGEPVSLDPYLGARGHLVAIREGDLEYAHVHPTGDDDGAVPFAVEPSTGGRYRLFFDFAVDGVVRTATFTVEVASSTSPSPDGGENGEH